MIDRLRFRLARPTLLAILFVCLVSIIELAIANRKFGVFTGGFGQSSAVDMPAEILLLLVGYGVSQCAVALVIWRLCALMNREKGAWWTLFHFAFAHGGVNLGVLTAQYQLHSYFSDAVDFALLKQLGGGSFLDALLFGKNEIAAGLAALGAYVAVWWACSRLARRWLPEGKPEPVKRPGRLTLVGMWFALAAMLALIPHTGSDAGRGLGLSLIHI
ncbi:MAG: hypothetical protein N2423_10580, partial [Novosphingobium sp.]|nr:hypothetical protein [Novosphingobium sp.]